LNFHTKENLCFNAVSSISKAYYANKEPLTAMSLALSCRTTHERMMQVLTPLEEAKILTRTEKGGYIPVHDPEQIMLSELWKIQRGELAKTALPHKLSSIVEEAVAKALKGKSLKDI
jgi:DNA-binding IscR family transcriptional regulator